MRIAAFDLSLTAPGFALADSGALVRSGVIPVAKGDLARLDEIRGKVMDLVDAHDAELVVFEDFSYGSADGKAFERAGLAYLIRVECWNDGRHMAFVSPQSVKKFIVGRGSSPKLGPVTKAMVIKELLKNMGHDVNDDNQADGIGLAYIGMALVGDWTVRTKAQEDVLQSVRKSKSNNLSWLKPAAALQSAIA